ncbi:hypothetical protein [Kitasatospora sp. NPDC004289]
MNAKLQRLLPARLLRGLGYNRAHTDPAGLHAELEDNRVAAWLAQPADLAKALPRLAAPLDFQPGLVGLHAEQVDTAAYLNTLAASAESNLNLADADQRALYADLIAAARAAEQLERAVAAAAVSTLPAIAGLLHI